MQVARPHQWQDFFMQETNELRKMSSNETPKKQMYDGELRNIHGAEEADRMIETGKVQMEEDSDGVTIYVEKLQFSGIPIATLKQQQERGRADAILRNSLT
eukprot:7463650-Karenia_brevis.AAC.1